MAIAVGTKAPDFTLKSKQASGLVDVKLSDNFGKKNTVLLFFPAAFTSVCTKELCEITTGLKALAKELNIPIIALSQLSRAVENREDKRPQLADLRESGSIEQDADIVMFVFREEYYLERLKPQEGTIEFQDWMAKMQLVSGRAEVIIGKQRHGPIGTVQLQFDGNVTRFSDLARDQYMPERRE